MVVVNFLGEKTNKVQKTRSVLLNLGYFANKEEDLHVNKWGTSRTPVSTEMNANSRGVLYRKYFFGGLPGMAANKFIDMSKTRKSNKK